MWTQITGFDVVNTWEYPGQELQIKHVSLSSYPDLFYALQVCTWQTRVMLVTCKMRHATIHQL